MKRTRDSLREHAAPYALDALDVDARRAFETHIRDGCRACADDVAAFASIAADLALAAPAKAPRPAIRERLLTAVRASGNVAEGVHVAPRFSFTLAGEGAWYEIAPGVSRKDLANPAGASTPSFLIRMQPGSSVAPHTHAIVEHCFLVEGDLHIAGEHLHAGDYHAAMPGSTHETIRSGTGCLLFIVEAHA